ncbi:MAG: bactofilin family protein [Gemmatimonadales bacterium]
MGMFSTNGTDPGVSRRRADPATLSIVASDLVITGDLRSEGVIRVEGRVAGNVIAGQQVLISKGGVVEGGLETREAVIAGTVLGPVIAAERVEVQATAQIHGDIVAPRLLIQEGGCINGGIRMETAATGADA